MSVYIYVHTHIYTRVFLIHHDIHFDTVEKS